MKRQIIRFVSIAVISSFLFQDIAIADPEIATLAVQSLFKPIKNPEIRDIGIIRFYLADFAASKLNVKSIKNDISTVIGKEKISVNLGFSGKDERRKEFAILNLGENEYIIPCRINRVHKPNYYAYITLTPEGMLDKFTVYTGKDFENVKKAGFIAHSERDARTENKIQHEQSIDTPLAIIRNAQARVELWSDVKNKKFLTDFHDFENIKDNVLKFFKAFGASIEFIWDVGDFISTPGNVSLVPKENGTVVIINGEKHRIPVKFDKAHASNNHINIPKDTYEDIGAVLVHELSAKCGKEHKGFNKPLTEAYEKWRDSGNSLNLKEIYPEIVEAVSKMRFKDLRRVKKRDYADIENVSHRKLIINPTDANLLWTKEMDYKKFVDPPTKKRYSSFLEPEYVDKVVGKLKSCGIEIADFVKGGRVLDIGFGENTTEFIKIIEHTANTAQSVWGAEWYGEFIDRAAKAAYEKFGQIALDKVRLYHCDASNMKERIEDKSVRFVYISGVVDDEMAISRDKKEAIVNEVRRVLEDGGIAVFCGDVKWMKSEIEKTGTVLLFEEKSDLRKGLLVYQHGQRESKPGKDADSASELSRESTPEMCDIAKEAVWWKDIYEEIKNKYVGHQPDKFAMEFIEKARVPGQVWLKEPFFTPEDYPAIIEASSMSEKKLRDEFASCYSEYPYYQDLRKIIPRYVNGDLVYYIILNLQHPEEADNFNLAKRKYILLREWAYRHWDASPKKKSYLLFDSPPSTDINSDLGAASGEMNADNFWNDFTAIFSLDSIVMKGRIETLHGLAIRYLALDAAGRKRVINRIKVLEYFEMRYAEKFLMLAAALYEGVINYKEGAAYLSSAEALHKVEDFIYKGYGCIKRPEIAKILGEEENHEVVSEPDKVAESIKSILKKEFELSEEKTGSGRNHVFLVKDGETGQQYKVILSCSTGSFWTIEVLNLETYNVLMCDTFIKNNSFCFELMEYSQSADLEFMSYLLCKIGLAIAFLNKNEPVVFDESSISLLYSLINSRKQLSPGRLPGDSCLREIENNMRNKAKDDPELKFFERPPLFGLQKALALKDQDYVNLKKSLGEEFLIRLAGFLEAGNISEDNIDLSIKGLIKDGGSDDIAEFILARRLLTGTNLSRKIYFYSSLKEPDNYKELTLTPGILLAAYKQREGIDKKAVLELLTHLLVRSAIPIGETYRECDENLSDFIISSDASKDSAMVWNLLVESKQKITLYIDELVKLIDMMEKGLEDVEKSGKGEPAPLFGPLSIIRGRLIEFKRIASGYSAKDIFAVCSFRKFKHDMGNILFAATYGAEKEGSLYTKEDVFIDGVDTDVKGVKNILEEVKGLIDTIKKKMSELRQKTIERLKTETEEDVIATLNLLYENIIRLLEYIDEGKEIYVLSNDDIGEVLSYINEDLSNCSKKKEISFSACFNPRFVKVKADKRALRELFSNIGYNAIDAMHKRGSLKIGSSVDIDKRTIYINFLDNGKGIAQENLPNIFNYRATFDKEGGTGLGLSNAREIVRAHNGNIRIYTKVSEKEEYRLDYDSAKNECAVNKSDENVIKGDSGTYFEISLPISYIGEEIEASEMCDIAPDAYLWQEAYKKIITQNRASNTGGDDVVKFIDEARKPSPDWFKAPFNLPEDRAFAIEISNMSEKEVRDNFAKLHYEGKQIDPNEDFYVDLRKIKEEHITGDIGNIWFFLYQNLERLNKCTDAERPQILHRINSSKRQYRLLCEWAYRHWDASPKKKSYLLFDSPPSTDINSDLGAASGGMSREDQTAVIDQYLTKLPMKQELEEDEQEADSVEDVPTASQDDERVPVQKDFENELIWLIPGVSGPKDDLRKKELIAEYQSTFDIIRSFNIRMKYIKLCLTLFREKPEDLKYRWGKLTGSGAGELGIAETTVRRTPTILLRNYDMEILPNWKKLQAKIQDGGLDMPTNALRSQPTILALDFENNIKPKWKKLTGNEKGELRIPEDKIRQNPNILTSSIETVLLRWSRLTGKTEEDLGIPTRLIRRHPSLLARSFSRKVLPLWQKLTGEGEGELGIQVSYLRSYPNILSLKFNETILPRWKKLTGEGAGDLAIPEKRIRQHPSLLGFSFENYILPNWRNLTGKGEGQLGMPEETIRQYVNLLGFNFKNVIKPKWDKITGSGLDELGFDKNIIRIYPDILTLDYEDNILPTWRALTGHGEGELGLPEDRVRLYPHILGRDYKGHLEPTYYYMTQISKVKVETIKKSPCLLNLSLHNKIRPRTMFLLANGVEVNTAVIEESRAKFYHRIQKKGLEAQKYDEFFLQYSEREERLNLISEIIKSGFDEKDIGQKAELKAKMTWLKIRLDEYFLALAMAPPEGKSAALSKIDKEIEDILMFVNYADQKTDLRKKLKNEIFNLKSMINANTGSGLGGISGGMDRPGRIDAIRRLIEERHLEMTDPEGIVGLIDDQCSGIFEVLGDNNDEKAKEVREALAGIIEKIERASVAIRRTKHGEWFSQYTFIALYEYIDLIKGAIENGVYNKEGQANLVIKELDVLRKAVSEKNKIWIYIINHVSEISKKGLLKIEDIKGYIDQLRDVFDALKLWKPQIEKVKSNFESYYADKDKDEKLSKLFSELVDTINGGIEESESSLSMVDAVSSKTKLSIGKIVHDICDKTMRDETVLKTSPSGLSQSFPFPWMIEDKLSPQGVTIYGDRINISSALLNIINNAVHFTRYVHDPFLKVILSQEGNFVRIDIVDSGKGIPKELLEIDPIMNRPKLFNLNVSQREGGTGLGTTEAWYAVKDMDGTIEVESELDKGTTFTIKLPIARESKPEKTADSVSELSQDAKEKESLAIIDVLKKKALSATDELRGALLNMALDLKDGEKILLSLDEGLGKEGTINFVGQLINDIRKAKDNKDNSAKLKEILDSIIIIRGRDEKLAGMVNDYIKEGVDGVKVKSSNVIMVTKASNERYCSKFAGDAVITFVNDSELDSMDYYPFVEVTAFTLMKALYKRGITEYSEARLARLLSSLIEKGMTEKDIINTYIDNKVANIKLRKTTSFNYDDLKDIYQRIGEFLRAA